MLISEPIEIPEEERPAPPGDNLTLSTEVITEIPEGVTLNEDFLITSEPLGETTTAEEIPEEESPVVDTPIILEELLPPTMTASENVVENTEEVMSEDPTEDPVEILEEQRPEPPKDSNVVNTEEE